MEKISKFAYRLRIKCKILLYNVGGVGKKDMKDFCKWLGVNEKVAKLIVWLFIGMSFLIVTNIMLESIGLPFYKITVDNLAKINTNKALEVLSAWLMSFFNFYSIVLLVFRTKEFKKIFKYAILYLVLNAIINQLFGYVVAQIYIFLFIILFCYFYSKKNWKYALYGLISILVNIFIQFICYLYKLRFINIENVSYFVNFITSIDYLIIVFVIIFIKELIIKNKER